MIDYQNNLSKEDILKFVSEESIYLKYIGYLPVNKSISNPLRKDLTPSFSLFYANNGKLLWKDHSYNETGDCFNFVMKLFNLNFKESLLKIYTDVLLTDNFLNSTNNKDSTRNNKRLYRHNNKTSPQISIQYKSFQKQEYQWWKVQGISEATLEKFNTKLADKVYINGFLKIISTRYNPCYVYTEGSKYRLYLPLNSKGKRWYGNMDSSCIQGLEYIPNNCDSLILIQKSYKDLMAIYEQLNIHGVCKPGEGYKWFPEDIQKVKQKSNLIVSNLDFDYCGIHNANDLKKNYNIPYIFMSNSRNQKRNDYTDNFRLFGKQYADTKLLTELEKLKIKN